MNTIRPNVRIRRIDPLSKFLIWVIVGLLVCVAGTAVAQHVGCRVIILPDGTMAQVCCFPNGACQIIK